VTGGLLFPRDGALTTGLESFEPKTIQDNRLWRESPVQLINTFFVGETFFLGLGSGDPTSEELGRRLSLSFGAGNVDLENPYVTLRSDGSEADESRYVALKNFLDKGGYFSEMPCPHNVELVCEVGLAWNRDMTRQPGVTLVFFRVDERVYAFMDTSLFDTEVTPTPGIGEGGTY